VPCVVVPSPVTRGLDFGGAAAVLPTLDGVTVGRLREIHRGFALARAGKAGE
jgi:NCAIR mutase (PurE)-related protein